MTEPQLPAVPEPTRLDEIARLGTWLAMSESGDSGEKARGAAAALRLYYAIELGLTPMAAADLTIINGRLFVGAQVIRALAIRAGYRITRHDSTDETCTARLISPNGEVLGEATYTLEMAKRAGNVKPRSGWETNPGRMCWARASKNVVVDFAPEVALGISLDDELQEINPQAVQSYDVDADEWPDMPDTHQPTEPVEQEAAT